MAAEKSMGTKLYLVEGETDTEVANLNSIGEIGVESDEIDVTDLASPNGYKEFIAGFKDGGELPLAGFVKSEENMQDMNDLAEAQTVESWKIVHESGSMWEFDGFVKTWKKGEDTPESVRTFNGSIRVSGKPEYTPAEEVSA